LAVCEVLKSGWLTTGPKTLEFEAAIAGFTGASHAVGVTSCTAALHLALVALGVGRGHEVITSPMTFVSTANVILHVGARPAFADVEPDTLCLDPDQVGRRITRRTRAIIPVHYAGHPCEMDGILKIAKRRRIPVVQDCAHSLEAEYRGRKLGGMTEVACYSFYATKNITTGEGGALTTNDPKLADRLRRLRLHGLQKDAWQRYSGAAFKRLDVVEAGYKYNMFDVQAALGLAQLRRVDAWWERRRAIGERYNRAFVGLPGIKLIRTRPHVKPAHHLYAVEATRSRDRLIRDLEGRGIGVSVHFEPVHRFSHYRKLGYRQGLCPVAEEAGARLISLPLYPRLSDAEVEQVIEAVRGAVTVSVARR